MNILALEIPSFTSMIVDRYHLSLSKIWPNLSLTVTMETETIENAQSNHADRNHDLVPKGTWALGTRLR